ncbi:transcriptional antiterminator BglG, partial [Enterococcus faecium]|nr:transcriptional antiterminator BglG [Enterococcus faecium]
KPTLAVENAVKIFIRSIRDIINCSVDELTIKALQIEFDLAITRSTKKIRVINTLYNKIIQKDPFLLGIASYIFQSTPLLKKLNFNRMDISRIVMIIKNNIDEFYLEYPKVRASLVSNAGLDQLFYAKQTIEKYLPFIKIQDFLSPEKLDKEKICSDVVISFEYLNTVNYPIVYTDYLLTYDKLMMMKQKIKNLLFVKKNFRQTSYKSVSLNTNNTYYL